MNTPPPKACCPQCDGAFLDDFGQRVYVPYTPICKNPACECHSQPATEAKHEYGYFDVKGEKSALKFDEPAPVEEHQIITIGKLMGCPKCGQGDSYVRNNPICIPRAEHKTWEERLKRTFYEEFEQVGYVAVDTTYESIKALFAAEIAHAKEEGAVQIVRLTKPLIPENNMYNAALVDVLRVLGAPTPEQGTKEDI